MPEGKRAHRQSDEHHDDRPTLLPRHAELVVQRACEGDQKARGDDGTHVPAHALQAGVARLIAERNRRHEHAVGDDVLRGRGKPRDPKEGEREGEKAGDRERKGDHAEGGHHQKLHRDHPIALRFERLEERRPERFQHPRQVELAGVDGDVFGRDAHVLVHDRSDSADRHVGQAHREIE